jgi:hypothetical protein
MARMYEIEGIEFNSVMYEANEWVLASEVAPYIKEAVKTSHNSKSTPLKGSDGVHCCRHCGFYTKCCVSQ